MPKQDYLYNTWPIHAVNLNGMRLNDKYCDVTIKVSGKEIRAHKVILAANLKYFEIMFSSNSFQESQNGVITMKSVDKADLELFISYAYTGEILLTESNALSLLELANYLGEDGIKESCIEFLHTHLRAEEACWAYQLAHSIDCLPLKNTAKSKMITNFEICSECVDYLDFNLRSLLDIFSDGIDQEKQSRKLFFQGLLRWIMHDPEERKFYMETLMKSIGVTALPSDEVIRCLYRNVVLRNDEYGITNAVIMYYENGKLEQEKDERVLVVLNDSAPSNYQFYDFTRKTWLLEKWIAKRPFNIYGYSAVINDKVYFINEHHEGNQLQVFDCSTMKLTTLHSSNRIWSFSALCTCGRFLYICGGVNAQDKKSKHIWKYDPQTNEFELLTFMTCERSDGAAVVHKDCIYVMGGTNGSTHLQSVEKYDIVKKEWTTVAPMNVKRRGHAAAVLNGKIYACGGLHIEPNAEVYDPLKNRWQPIANMNKRRSFFLVVNYKGKLLAVSGGERTVEVYDPSKNQWTLDADMSAGLHMACCVGGLIPLSCVADK